MDSIWLDGIAIEIVDDLYRRYKAMDISGYYQAGEQNPWAGRCKFVPQTARFYIMISERDEDRILLARFIMKKIGGRKKVVETVCEKHELNYNQFAYAGRIILMYV